MLESKKVLIAKIEPTNDDNILSEICKILESCPEVDNRDNSEIFLLSDKSTSAIDQRMYDFENGRIMSNEDAKKEIQEWLQK